MGEKDGNDWCAKAGIGLRLPKLKRKVSHPWQSTPHLYRGRMFVDECTVNLAAGDGGRGCIGFRREKYEPWGGPNGGDGGRGGDVILLGDVNTNNLVDYKYQPHWRGERGEHGQGSDCTGRDGKPAILKMPLGTVVIDLGTDKPVAELVADGQQIVLCKGGN